MATCGYLWLMHLPKIATKEHLTLYSVLGTEYSRQVR